MNELLKNPLVRAVAQVGMDLLEEEVRHRCAKLSRAPAGYVLRAWQARARQIAAEQRSVTDVDIHEFCDQIPELVRQARQAEGGAP